MNKINVFCWPETKTLRPCCRPGATEELRDHGAEGADRRGPRAHADDAQLRDDQHRFVAALLVKVHDPCPHGARRPGRLATKPERVRLHAQDIPVAGGADGGGAEIS